VLTQKPALLQEQARALEPEQQPERVRAQVPVQELLREQARRFEWVQRPVAP
jgi:hypothetical protein